MYDERLYIMTLFLCAVLRWSEHGEFDVGFGKSNCLDRERRVGAWLKYSWNIKGFCIWEV